MPMQRSLNQDFFKNWTPEMAYVLGYFAADGSMIQNKRGGKYIEFTSCDRELLEIVQTVTNAHQVIAPRAVRNSAWQLQYRIQIGSNQWFTDLERLGFFSNKSLTMSFPCVPGDVLGHFVRGYFDGDGCVYFKQHWSKSHKRNVWVFTSLFTSGSRGFLESLHAQLQKEGVRGGHISKKQRGFALVFSRRDSLALYRIMYNTSQASCSFLPRKQERFQEAIRTLAMRL